MCTGGSHCCVQPAVVASQRFHLAATHTVLHSTPPDSPYFVLGICLLGNSLSFAVFRGDESTISNFASQQRFGGDGRLLFRRKSTAFCLALIRHGKTRTHTDRPTRTHTHARSCISSFKFLRWAKAQISLVSAHHKTTNSTTSVSWSRRSVESKKRSRTPMMAFSSYRSASVLCCLDLCMCFAVRIVVLPP